ncbi:MAG: RluA family pseudouridine synthase [Desulfuromonadales bacterium]|nr:RluA family pseudouridine synthase [Desulfuromonadales bacterium]
MSESAPEFLTLTVQKGEEHLPFLVLLQRRIPLAPVSYLRQLLRQGKVRRGEQILSAEARLPIGACVLLPESKRLRELLAMTTLQILFETRDLLIVAKPPGLAVHASEGHEIDNLTARCQELLKQRGERFSIAPVHRLDLETSGPLLFGKGKAACGALGKLFMEDQVEIHYLALVQGEMTGEKSLEGLVPAKGKLKSARTDVRTLAGNGSATLLEIRLHSGRQHQIRRQLAEIGHPLFGDKRYGGPYPSDLPRLFLHCHRLAFLDPCSGTPIDCQVPLPADLAGFLERCGIAFPAQT